MTAAHNHKTLIPLAGIVWIMTMLTIAGVAAQPIGCTNQGHDHCDPNAHDFSRGLRTTGSVAVSETGGLGRLEIHGNKAAVLQKDEGAVAIVDLSNPDRPEVMGRYEDGAQGSLDGDLAFSHDGDWVIYARQTRTFSRDGIHILDVSDPAAPSLAFYQPQGGASRVLYHRDEAGEWVVVLDAITGFVVNRFDPATGALVPVYGSPAPAGKVGGPASAGLALEQTEEGTLLYVTTGRTGLEIYDFTNPADPALVGSWSEEAGLAEVESVTRAGRRLVYVATEYWFATNMRPQVIVLDATNLDDIREVARWDFRPEPDVLWRIQGMDSMGTMLVAAHSHAGVVVFDPRGAAKLRSDSFATPRITEASGPATPYAFDVEVAGRFIYVTDAGSGRLTVLRRG